MATLATLNVEIGANTAGFDKGIKGVEGSLQHLGAEAARTGAAFGGSVSGGMDAAAAAATKAGRAIQGSAASFASAARDYQTIGRSIQNVGEGLSKFVTLPLTLLAGASLKAYGDLQSLEKGFTAVYKGAAPVSEELEKLRDVAKLPGLGLKEAIQGSIRLQAVGFNAEKARQILVAFGSAIATTGGGKEDLDEVTRQLGQIASVGKVTAENLNVIKERSPLVGQAIKDAFGTSNTEELQKMGVTSEEFITRLTAQLAKLPTVTGGVKNAFENFGDAGFIAFARIGEALNNTFNVEGVLDRMSTWLLNAANAFGNLNPVVQGVVFALAGLAAAAGPILLAVGGFISLIPTLTAGLNGVGAAFAVATGPIGLLVIGLAAAGVAVYVFQDEIRRSMALAANAIADGLNTMTNGLTKFDVGLRNSLGDAAKAMGLDTIAQFFYDSAEASAKFGQSIQAAKVDMDALGGSTAHLSAVITPLAPKASVFGRGFQEAFGGVSDNIFTVGNTITAVGTKIDEFVRKPAEKKIKVTIEKVGAVDALQSNIAAGLENIKPPKTETGGMTLAGLLGIDLAAKLPVDQPIIDGFAAAELAARAGVLKLGDAMTGVQQVVFDTTTFMQQALGTALVSFGELIGQSFSGGFGGMQSFLNGFLGIVIDFAGQLGKVLIGLGLGALTLKSLGMNPVAAVIAGTALVALAGVAKSLLAGGPKFSGGGSGSSGGVSAVTPYKSPAAAATFTTPGMGAESAVHFEIEGTKLVGVLRNTNYKDGR